MFICLGLHRETYLLQLLFLACFSVRDLDKLVFLLSKLTDEDQVQLLFFIS